jgi:diguanylate cyclase (GGDEF)-like protein
MPWQAGIARPNERRAAKVDPMTPDPIRPFNGVPIRLLLIEDSEEDYRRTCALLDAARHVTFAIEWARSAKDALMRLGAGAYDVCLVDQNLPGGEELEFVRAAHDRGFRTPTIMLTGCSTLEFDFEAMALGVSEFLDKSRIDAPLLERTIHCALARHRQAERLNRLAQYDELTGLANRSLFQDRLGRALAWARRNDRLVAVMVLDLNGFKAVNDRLGHSAGDRLLNIMAKRLAKRLRETDTVARLGGDEFALLIENLAEPEHAALVARKLLDAVAPAVELDEQQVSVTASLGVALYPADGRDPAELVRQADRAMYRAKTEGGNLCRFSSDQPQRRTQRATLLESDLRRALAQDELLLHYQPQVTLRPGSLGISAMVRWAHPELGLIGPERFLPLVEDSGLLPLLTDWLCEAACAQARHWSELGLGPVHLAVPLLSHQQPAWTELAAHLHSCLRSAALSPARLEVEVGEPLLLADTEAGGAGIAALDEIGVRIALNGFGTGPMSLRGLPLGVLDTIKLARELHHDVPDDQQRSALVRAIVLLAKDLGQRVVAEAVDRHDQLAFLRHAGCDAVQAFMSCPPLPAAACTSWLRQASSRQSGGRDGAATSRPAAAGGPRPAYPQPLPRAG